MKIEMYDKQGEVTEVEKYQRNLFGGDMVDGLSVRLRGIGSALDNVNRYSMNAEWMENKDSTTLTIQPEGLSLSKGIAAVVNGYELNLHVTKSIKYDDLHNKLKQGTFMEDCKIEKDYVVSFLNLDTDKGFVAEYQDGNYKIENHEKGDPKADACERVARGLAGKQGEPGQALDEMIKYLLI